MRERGERKINLRHVIAGRIPRQVLERKRPVMMAKIELIEFAMAAAELLPYLLTNAVTCRLWGR